VLGGLVLEVGASLGVAVYPEHGNRVDVLLNRADTAMYAAKAAGPASPSIPTSRSTARDGG